MNYEPTTDKQGPSRNPLPTESHSDNPVYSRNLQPNQQQSDHSKPSGASATEKLDPGKCNKPSKGTPSKRRTNNSEHKYYTCEYSYEGRRWSIELPATSWEDAEARLKRLAYGKVLGELKAIVPYELGWLARTWVWLRRHM